MDNGIKKIERVISEIEEHITEEIDFSRLSSNMGLSLYEFRRIFSFIVGCPLSEYIRKRKLSLAALEIMNNKKLSIQAISEKYGYGTESAFSKAFREQHGVAPRKCREGECGIELFTIPRFELTIKGISSTRLTVIEEGEYSIVGLKKPSPLTDTCCCDEVWREFYDKGYEESVSGDKIYAAYLGNGDEVICTVGDKKEVAEGALGQTVPASRWAIFKMNTTDDDIVNRRYGEIIYDILPSAGLTKREDAPIVEVFPLDMSEEDFEWEIRIAIK